MNNVNDDESTPWWVDGDPDAYEGKWVGDNVSRPAPPPRFFLDVRDPSGIAHYSENFQVG